MSTSRPPPHPPPTIQPNPCLHPRPPQIHTNTLTLQREYEDMPLKTFYRYVLPALPAGDGPPTAATAEFSRLPGSKVLTLGMDEPEAW